MADAPWMMIAEAELGITEFPGAKHNNRILEYHATTGLSADDDETPWCSSFVNWNFQQLGMRAPAARRRDPGSGGAATSGTRRSGAPS